MAINLVIDLDHAAAAAYELGHLLAQAMDSNYSVNGGANRDLARKMKAAEFTKHFFGFLTQDMTVSFAARKAGLTVHVRALVDELTTGRRFDDRAQSAQAIVDMADAHCRDYSTPHQLKGKMERIKHQTVLDPVDKAERARHLQTLQLSLLPAQVTTRAMIHARAVDDLALNPPPPPTGRRNPGPGRGG